MERDILHPTDEDLSAETSAWGSYGVLREGPEVKYAYIDKRQRLWPIRALYKVLKVSFTGYHQHQLRLQKIALRRHMSDAALLVHIRAIHRELRGAYGWPRMWRVLRYRGVRVGKERVRLLMQ
jgi:hypothetical protein